LNNNPERLQFLLSQCAARFRTWKDELKEAHQDKDSKKQHEVYSRFMQEKHKILTDWGIIPSDGNI